MLCSWPIWKFGTAEQKAKFLKPLAEGTKLGAFGLTEPNAGTDALNGSTSAVKNEDGSYTLTGSKVPSTPTAAKRYHRCLRFDGQIEGR